jgi:hypothetical protein
MSTPLIGRNAVIQYVSGGTSYTIGYAQNITSAINVDKIEEFALNSDKPVILAAGNKHFKITCGRLYIDETYSAMVLAGNPVDFVIGPAGTTTGKTKVTIKNVVLTVRNLKADQKGVVAEDVQGDGADYQVGTF